MKAKTVTCSFELDRDIYNEYKSIVMGNGENVKGNLVRYMLDVITYNTPNAQTIAALEEVKRLKAQPNKRTYGSFAELLEDIDNDEIQNSSD